MPRDDAVTEADRRVFEHARRAERLTAMTKEMTVSCDSAMNRELIGEDNADREVVMYRRQATRLRRQAGQLRHRYARGIVGARQRQPQVVGTRRTSPRAPRSRRHVRRAQARSPGREPPPDPDPARIACSGGFVALLGVPRA